eukprot:3857507-Rhodomonas_salina.2
MMCVCEDTSSAIEVDSPKEGESGDQRVLMGMVCVDTASGERSRNCARVTLSLMLASDGYSAAMSSADAGSAVPMSGTDVGYACHVWVRQATLCTMSSRMALPGRSWRAECPTSSRANWYGPESAGLENSEGKEREEGREGGVVLDVPSLWSLSF